ncbi:MAG TPA: hypothetical protein VE619_04565 [Nitrososphaeraceae archaeon]|nr:hypothetical protein [Nitrososphaeraceae archaeon]
MKDLSKHSKIKTANYGKSGIINYQEFHARYSKPIIDKIDEVLSSYYGLTDEEKNFIIHYDEQYRLQELG